ncbi:tyrosine aminotransferase [Toxorhynchites rutilus septentrionalis]|uniref:tyrosine aminotransferase n=1 Tax=Toxorhynchites rutilus septentrionalis TaxID=329112 RepID=UPI0024799693|nr:tyrosine aminotransferase [Toxorhynchites rutilus septentrionalis]
MKDLEVLTAKQLKPSRLYKSVRTHWTVAVSDFARLTHNPIRAIVEGLKIVPNPDKQLIALSIGDPTTFGNLKPAPEIVDAIRKVIEDGCSNGYGPSTGFPEARQAVADYVSHQGEVTANDVILCSGCSCALDLCLSVLAGPGQNILIPKPGFSIYRTLAEGFGIECRYYDLIPENDWEVDLLQLESLIDANTAALILTNPSNPCGSVFSKNHLEAILEIAERYFLPIIADEIYEHFVFPGREFHSVSSLSKKVPVLSCGGLTKRFLVPGWRMGWIIIHDREDIFRNVRKGLANLSARILGANTLVQAALPDVLKNTPPAFYEDLVSTLYRHAEMAYKAIKHIRGLRPVMPGGAMYMMIGIDIECFPEFETDLEFVQALVAQQSVFCLPGQCFEYPNYVRIVLTVPEEMIIEACKRLDEFCEKHYKRDDAIIEEQNGLLGGMNRF